MPIVQPEPLPALPTAVSAIPLAPLGPEMDQAAAREGHHDDPDLEVPRPRRRRLKRRRSLLLAGILFIGGGLSLGTLLAFVVGVVLWALSKTEDPPAIVNTAAGKAVAGKFRDDAQHYALELPRHWRVMPAAVYLHFSQAQKCWAHLRQGPAQSERLMPLTGPASNGLSFGNTFNRINLGRHLRAQNLRLRGKPGTRCHVPENDGLVS